MFKHYLQYSYYTDQIRLADYLAQELISVAFLLGGLTHRGCRQDSGPTQRSRTAPELSKSTSRRDTSFLGERHGHYPFCSEQPDTHVHIATRPEHRHAND